MYMLGSQVARNAFHLFCVIKTGDDDDPDVDSEQNLMMMMKKKSKEIMKQETEFAFEYYAV